MEFIDIEELSTRTTLSIDTLRRLTRQKAIPFIKVNRRVLFNPVAINAWLEGKASYPVEVANANAGKEVASQSAAIA